MAVFRDDDLFDAARIIAAGGSIMDCSVAVQPAYALLVTLMQFYELCEFYNIDPEEALNELIEALERGDA